jgi:hypothetical protein
MNAYVPLSQAVRELTERYPHPRMNYNAVHRGVLGGRIPARRHDGRWFIDRADYPAMEAFVARLSPPGAYMTKNAA